MLVKPLSTIITLYFTFFRIIWCRLLERWNDRFKPEEWGWKIGNNQLSSVWMTVKEAAKSCSELVKLRCTELCKCNGNCYNLDSEN